MRKPPHVVEIILQPGNVHFGEQSTRIRTILGSCVAVTLWHPERLVGGMCHYMVPSRKERAASLLDGRYADEAMELLLAEIRKHQLHPREFHAKFFGGGMMFAQEQHNREGIIDIHRKNMEAGEALIRRHGFILKANHLGGEGHRQVIFDVWSGDVWMRQTPLESCASQLLAGKVG